MRTVQDIRANARQYYERERGKWVEGLTKMALDLMEYSADEEYSAQAIRDAFDDGKQAPTYDRSLQPPTEAQALSAMHEVSDWVAGWKAFRGAGAVQWADRKWHSVGTQHIPVRLAVHGVTAIAALCGKTDEWERLCVRIVEYCEFLLRESSQGAAIDPAAVAHGLRGATTVLASTEDGEWSTALSVVRWIDQHPGTSCYIRELPIRGIDTKWIEAHRKLVTPLARILTGSPTLPFLEPPSLVRFRWLDESLARCGITDFSSPVNELAAIQPVPDAVIICENLVSVLSLPRIPGTAAIFGQGYGVELLKGIPWLADVPVVYWGDIDSHGFAILDRLRSFIPAARSVMMDRETLHEFSDLCVREPSSQYAAMERLTENEQGTLAELFSVSPPLRLEQERIPWEYVLSQLASLAMKPDSQ